MHARGERLLRREKSFRRSLIESLFVSFSGERVVGRHPRISKALLERGKRKFRVKVVQGWGRESCCLARWGTGGVKVDSTTAGGGIKLGPILIDSVQPRGGNVAIVSR